MCCYLNGLASCDLPYVGVRGSHYWRLNTSTPPEDEKIRMCWGNLWCMWYMKWSYSRDEWWPPKSVIDEKSLSQTTCSCWRRSNPAVSASVSKWKDPPISWAGPGPAAPLTYFKFLFATTWTLQLDSSVGLFSNAEPSFYCLWKVARLCKIVVTSE